MATSLNGLAPHKKPRLAPTNPVTVVLGSQWGDEGKGKIVDMIAATADICCRCQVRIFVFLLLYFTVSKSYLLKLEKGTFYTFVSNFFFLCIWLFILTLIDLPNLGTHFGGNFKTKKKREMTNQI